MALLASGARAERSPRVGIIVAISVNTSAEEATRVASGLGAALQQELSVDVIAGDEVARRLPDGGLSDVCVVDPECVRKAGDRLGADQLLILAIVKVGTHLQIDPTLVDVQSGKAVSRPAIQLEAGAETSWAAVFTAATTELLPNAAVRAPAEPKDDTNKPVDDHQATPEATPLPTVEHVVHHARPRHLTRGALIAAAVGGAALTGGVVFALKARSGYNDLDDRGCDSMACDADDIDRVGRQALYADLLLGAGLVAAATAGVLYLRSGRAESRSLQVITTPEVVQVSLRGSF